MYEGRGGGGGGRGTRMGSEMPRPSRPSPLPRTNPMDASRRDPMPRPCASHSAPTCSA